MRRWYTIFLRMSLTGRRIKKLCDTVTALIRPTDEVLGCACGTGLLTGVIAHKRRSRLSPV